MTTAPFDLTISLKLYFYNNQLESICLMSSTLGSNIIPLILFDEDCRYLD